MQAELKAWLDDAAKEAARIYEEDYQNEKEVLTFWDYNAVSQELVETLQNSISEEGNPNLVEFYHQVEQNPKLNISPYDFDTNEIAAIAKSAYPAYLFALYVLKAPFPAGEEAISRHPFLWGEYTWIMEKLGMRR